MSTLYHTVYMSIAGYVEDSDMDTATKCIVELIEQERRAAAEAMRERCSTVAHEAYQRASTEETTELADSIRYKINNLPLDSDGGA